MEFNKLVQELLEKQRPLAYNPPQPLRNDGKSKEKNGRNRQQVATPQPRTPVQPPPLPVAQPQARVDPAPATQEDPVELQSNTVSQQQPAPKQNKFSNFVKGAGRFVKGAAKLAGKAALAPITVPLAIDRGASKLAGKINKFSNTGRFSDKKSSNPENVEGNTPAANNSYVELKNVVDIERAANYNKLFVNTPNGLVNVKRILNPKENNSTIKWMDDQNKAYISKIGDFYMSKGT
jgi:hypothetical protein